MTKKKGFAFNYQRDFLIINPYALKTVLVMTNIAQYIQPSKI